MRRFQRWAASRAMRGSQACLHCVPPTRLWPLQAIQAGVLGRTRGNWSFSYSLAATDMRTRSWPRGRGVRAARLPAARPLARPVTCMGRCAIDHTQPRRPHAAGPWPRWHATACTLRTHRPCCRGVGCGPTQLLVAFEPGGVALELECGTRWASHRPDSQLAGQARQQRHAQCPTRRSQAPAIGCNRGLLVGAFHAHRPCRCVPAPLLGLALLPACPRRCCACGQRLWGCVAGQGELVFGLNFTLRCRTPAPARPPPTLTSAHPCVHVCVCAGPQAVQSRAP